MLNVGSRCKHRPGKWPAWMCTCVRAHTCTSMQEAAVGGRNRERSSFRGELFMLMLLNYWCYLCFCDVCLSLKAYCELSWQPVNTQQVWIYQCSACVFTVSVGLRWQQSPAALMPSLCCTDTEAGCQVIALATSFWQLDCRQGRQFRHTPVGAGWQGVPWRRAACRDKDCACVYVFVCVCACCFHVQNCGHLLL